MTARRFLSALAALPLLLAACRKAEVTSYRIPKEADPPLPMAAADASAGPMAGGAAGAGMAATAVPTADGPGLRWTAPADWKVKVASAMRKGSYAVPGDGGADGDLSITAFPGDVGGELANVNRWRGQVQLPPLAEADLAQAVSRATHGGLQFTIVELTSPAATNPQAILGAIVLYNGGTWFFKLLGPAPLVARTKPAFLQFLQTVQPVQP
jgi:hypothetical protein